MNSFLWTRIDSINKTVKFLFYSVKDDFVKGLKTLCVDRHVFMLILHPV